MTTPLNDQINRLSAANAAKFNTDIAYGQGTSEYDVGNTILGTLNLPSHLNPSSVFAWSVSKPTAARTDDRRAGMSPDAAQLTQMTMAGAMDWLRSLAVNQGQPGGDYDAIVAQLVAAGYLKPSEARYGSFTTTVGNAFLQSAADVWHMNGGNGPTTGAGPGQLVTWGDHMNALIDARVASGQIDPKTHLPTSASGGGSAPQRTDKFTNPDDVKASINSAAENILGRKLTDKEAAGFQSLYHGLESKANDQAWAAQTSTATTTPSVTSAPSVGAEAQNYMDTSPAFGQERTTQLLGGYINVLRNMTGLGTGGNNNAIG